MTDTDIWKPLVAELDRWKRHGKQAQFWLRDDDAVVPTKALDQLLDLSGRFAIPICLAVIPKETGGALARRLQDLSDVSVALHGWSHENHAPADEKKQELGLHRGADIVLSELRCGTAHLATLYRQQFSGILVPPWNRIDKRLVTHLPGLGLSGLSTFGPEQMLPIPAINTHVDLIDWKGTRGGRATEALIADTVYRLQTTFIEGGSVGFLTHHLVHDRAVWDFLERLFRLTTRHSGCTWRPAAALLPDPDQA